MPIFGQLNFEESTRTWCDIVGNGIPRGFYVPYFIGNDCGMNETRKKLDEYLIANGCKNGEQIAIWVDW